MPQRLAFALLICALAAGLMMACFPASSPFVLTLTLRNPTPLRFEGSGGAVGLGLEVRLPGAEGGLPLVVDRECGGRACGTPTVTDPGRCGRDPQVIEAHADFDPVQWDGRYFPRGADLWGPCLGNSRAVAPNSVVKVTWCGRLRDKALLKSPLTCSDTDVELSSFALDTVLLVPGSDAYLNDGGIPDGG